MGLLAARALPKAPSEAAADRLLPEPPLCVSARPSLESGHGPSGDPLLPLPAQLLYSGQGTQGLELGVRWEGEVRLCGHRVKDENEQSTARDGGRASGRAGRGEGEASGPSRLPLPQDYSVEGMSDSLLNFLQHLREFGLVFQRKV